MGSNDAGALRAQGMATALLNRAIANDQLGRWPESYCDARLATKLAPRRAKARAAMGTAVASS
jgi:hypothetical protein